MRRQFWSIATAVMSLALMASAEELSTTTTPPAPGKAVGVIDVRPTWASKPGSWGTEDSIELGYQFNPKVTVTYVQGILSQLYQTSGEVSMKPTIDDGFIRTRVNKIWEDTELGLTLGYQSRVYVPVSEGSRDKGQILVSRNYFNLSKNIGKFTVTLTEMPVIPFYTKAGLGKSANPIFENRVYLTTDFNLTESLVLTFPVMFHQTRYGSFDGAANSNSWAFTVWTYPEIDWQWHPNSYVGVAYYSSNLVAGNLSSVDVGAGLGDGYFQFVLGANL